jgi:hypothetical protein
MAGLSAARARGKKGGRPKSPISEHKKLQMAKQMYEDKKIPVADIWVVSLNCRDDVLSGEYHKIRAAQGTKVP